MLLPICEAESAVSEQQTIGIRRSQEAGATTMGVCLWHGISPATFYQEKAKFGVLELSEARRLRTLRAKIAWTRCLLANAQVDD